MNCPFLLQLILEFVTYLSTERRYSPHTVAGYQLDLEQYGTFLRTTYDQTPLEASATSIRTWISQLMLEPYAASSVHRKVSTLRAFYRFIQKRGLRSDNPAKGVPRPKKQQHLPTFIESSAMSRLELGIAPNEGIGEQSKQLILRLLYETGMRQSELLGLSDSSVDLRNGQLRVYGKRSKERYIPLSEELRDTLQAYQNARKNAFGETNQGTFLVTESNKKITKSFVYRIVRLYLSEVTTAKKRSPHVLRHTFATHMLNNGADLNVIKEILGHSSLAATQVYTHNNIEKLKQVHLQMHPRNKS